MHNRTTTWIGIFAAAVGLLLIIDHFTRGDSWILHALSGVGLLLIVIVLAQGNRRASSSAKLRIQEVGALEELQQDKHAAQAANLAKSRHLASVSHEIRSPLNAIYGYAQLVERNDGVSAQEAAQVIRRCTEQVTALVDGLLDSAQAENAVLRLKHDVLELAPFLDQVVAMLRPAAEAKGIVFHYIVDSTLPQFVRTDQSRLRQVLINLLSNAIKFTDRGSVTLRVSYRAQMARFEIADTGPGIALPDQQRIFEPFVRGRDDGRPGVGLGLPITKAIVEILGGKLELISEAGRGTSFIATLMLSEMTGKLPHGNPSRHVSGYLGPRRTVLIAEDDAEQRSFLARLLESLGFEVLTAGNGEAALAISERGAVDLAILDIAMPRLSGWQTAVRLRQRLGADVRVLMLSGNAQEFHRPDFPEPVHDMFLVKPIEFGALIEAIGGLLALSWTWGQADAPTPREHAPVGQGVALNEPARGHVACLSEYLRIGYVRGMEEEIRQLGAADASAGPLVRELIDSLDRFDLAAMARSLEQV